MLTTTMPAPTGRHEEARFVSFRWENICGDGSGEILALSVTHDKWRRAYTASLCRQELRGAIITTRISLREDTSVSLPSLPVGRFSAKSFEQYVQDCLDVVAARYEQGDPKVRRLFDPAVKHY